MMSVVEAPESVPLSPAADPGTAHNLSRIPTPFSATQEAPSNND